jgi:DNA polymerase III epsilon subunit-like protein
MKFLVFDTETTGLPPKNRVLNAETIDDWPYIVQFSYVLYDDETNRILKIFDSIVKLPENIIMSIENINIHGITNEIMTDKGTSLLSFLDEFMIDLENVDRVVGHNLEFDINMLKVEIMRKMKYELYYFEAENYYEYLNVISCSKKYVCTMQETIDLCGIERTNKKGKYNKFPKLSELHYKLYNVIPNNLHNSLNDVLVCLRCYCQLHNKVDILEKNVELKYIFQKILL